MLEVQTKADRTKTLPAKLIACVIVVACLVIGAVGLILPIIPGLLFLAIAALIVVKHFPWMEHRLRRNGAIDRNLDRADSFLDLTLWRKVQLSGWLCVKVLLDTLAFVGSLVPKLLSFATAKRTYR